MSTQPRTTQSNHPWRSTLRTAVQAAFALLALLPLILEAAPELAPYLGGVVVIAGVVARVMAVPGVEDFLNKYLNFLAADPLGKGEE